MMLKLASLALCLLHLAASIPAPIETTDLARFFENGVNFESLNRHPRGSKSSSSNDGEYYKSDNSEANGEIGYSRKKSGGGKKGYQHFDSYHKKAGDNYEFEKQDSYGLDDEGQDGAYSHRNERRVAKDDDRDYEGFTHDKERIREPEDIEGDIDEEPRKKKSKSKHRKDIDHAELREDADDGNGGVEAYGHDPNDYVLPEKYVIGEEYKF